MQGLLRGPEGIEAEPVRGESDGVERALIIIQYNIYIVNESVFEYNDCDKQTY